MVRPKILVGLKGRFHQYFHSVHWYSPIFPRPQSPGNRELFYACPDFRPRVRESAIMAMNSELVGLPLILDTV